MTIDALPSDRTPRISESPLVAAAPASATRTVAANASAPVINADDVQAAVQQTAISNGPNPDFKLDYLSGLSVVTVRSTITGQVVYQLPDTRALQLARMIKDGASVGSVGLFSTTA
jgi:hypothetical protein